ncbi:MAG: precorrin-3B C17-methyltransferase / cobalt-factor methyltransferase [Euryarchaeota archaeon]|nr:precorrin-3B C17-methyltransferase / cobalt-factor methyltransferase [Euryarchaeota archaeon]
MPSENKLSIVGIGPGSTRLRTWAATRAIRLADFVVGYRPYLELISDLLPGKQVLSSSMGKEVDRVAAAIDLLEKGSVALVSSGDPNVYGMAGLGLELAEKPCAVEIVPGVTSFTAAACEAGLAFRECVAVISLSDLLTPWQQIEGRLRLAAETAMPVALYNPKSKRRDWQLLRALDICGARDVLVAKNIGREAEEIFYTSSQKLIEEESLRERIDMTTLVIILGRGTFRGVACQKAAVNLVGIGPGDPANLTQEAASILQASQKIYGAHRYLELIGDLTSAQKVTHSGPCPERMAARLKEAKQMAAASGIASILTGGDPSIFSSGWRIMDQAEGAPVHISPGVSAFSSVAARAGAPLVNDFALLSSAHDPARLGALAGAGFAVVAYNVKGQEIASLLEEVDPIRPVVLAQDVAREEENIMILTAEDLQAAKPTGFRYTMLVASANSHIEEGRIITKRGYESKYSY